MLIKFELMLTMLDTMYLRTISCLQNTLIYIIIVCIQTSHRGPQLYFHIARYMLKEKGGHFFLLPKVKVEFRHLFSLQKRFSLCSFHNINANIVVLLIDWFTVE